MLYVRYFALNFKKLLKFDSRKITLFVLLYDVFKDLEPLLVDFDNLVIM